MAAFEYTLPAVRGIQAGREYFVTMCPLELVPRLFHQQDHALRPELRAQRVVNKLRVPEIARYIAAHPKTYALSALTGSIDGAVCFEEAPVATNPAALGLLKVPMSARFLLQDGLHRLAAIQAALKARPELGHETIALVLFVDVGLKRAEQLFTDLHRNGRGSARSQGILYDHRDEMARLARALVKRVPVFNELTELIHSKISNRSVKLFTLSAIYHATKALLADKHGQPFSDKLTLASDFWSAVVKHIPDWQRVRTNEISPAELRRTTVHAHALALAALGKAGRTLIETYPGSWKPKLAALQTLDWSRSNTRLWEGRAMIAGRLSKATVCVLLTGNAIKQHLRLPLTAEEQEAEKQVRARS